MQITNTSNAIWPVPFNLDENVFQSLPELEIYTLASGLRVLLLPGIYSRSVKFEVFVNGGALHQQTNKRGVPHFLEHMMFRSTKDFSDNEKLVEFAQDFNLDWNAYTSEDYQAYHVASDLDDEATDAAAHLLSEIVLHPRLEEKYVEMEKQIIYAEQQAGESEPVIVTGDVQTNHFVGQNHPLGGGGIIGEAETILSYTHSDLIDFHGKYFNPSNMLLVITGGIGKDRMKALVDKYFAVSEPTSWNENPLIGLERQTTELETIAPRDFNHINVHLGFYIPKSKFSKYTLEEVGLNTILHALSTRLYLDIREKQGLAYSVYATYTEVAHGFFVYAAAEFAKDKYIEGRKQLEKYFLNLADFKITAEEFRRAIRAQKSMRWADNVQVIASNAARKLFVDGSLVSPEYRHKWIDQLTLEYVNDLPQKLFKDMPLETIVVGPVS